MARDLPYFKFIVSEWNDGDIRLCSFEAQGLFINLCALYWSSGGNLSLTKSMRRYSACNAVAFEELQQEGIIKVDGDNISISFLDEQFEERSQLSRKNAENAANGWGKRKKDATALPNNATALPKESDPIDLACNIEKRREEKNREEEKREEKRPQSAIENPFVNDPEKTAWDNWIKHRKEINKSIKPTTAKMQIQFLGGRAGPEIAAIINQSITNGWTGLFELKKQNNNGNWSGNKETIRRADAVTTSKDFGSFDELLGSR